MRLFSIASGSSGNCIYVGDGIQLPDEPLCTNTTGLLIDAGISTKRIVDGLLQNNIDPARLDAILITHEHSDHVRGLSVLSRKYQIPIYGTYKTLQHILRSSCGERIPRELFVPIETNKPFSVGNIEVVAHSISHDAADPVMYTLTGEDKKIGVATDMGCYTDEIIEALGGSDVLYLESNYDRNMLLVGIYPYVLKQRILSSTGHLSNDDSAELLCSLMHEQLKVVILAHLSKENNYPELAYQCMKNAIESSWHYETGKPQLIIAGRDVPMDCIEI